MSPHQRAGNPGVSVVIPAFNEEAVLRRCLLAVLDQTVAAEQIIVVDNGSTDGTRAVVTQLQAQHPKAPLTLIQQSAEQGLIPTRNAGLDAADADVLGRIDADSVLASDWVKQVQRAFQDPELSAVTGPVFYYDLPMPRLGLAIDNAGRHLMMKRVADRHPFLYGSNMAIRRTAWQQIRSTVCRDEHDQMHEDIDLSLHLNEHGLKIAYLPTMITGVSARRMDDSPACFRYYVSRYRRTYSAHQVTSPIPLAATIILRSLYWPLKLVRFLRRPPLSSPPTGPPIPLVAPQGHHRRPSANTHGIDRRREHRHGGADMSRNHTVL
ncbi:glycosyltransferase [Kocuria turfanensis]|uniref:glycosyltransferase n=1 Tax=Kocuria turfanensis TaxID=388357 RepID=UPI00403520D6